MDHKEQHHQAHLKEREREKKEKAAYELEKEKKSLPVHPAWLFLVGVVLMFAAILIWTLLS